ncbi:MAG: 50S ribosomal protein L3 N(5)-glutamine methyltransferase [Pseudomonadota bacterium]
MSELFNFNNLIPLSTVRDWLRWAVSRFNEAELHFGHGSSTAYDEAAYLILHTLHLPLNQLEPYLDAHLAAEERKALFNIIEARVKTRKPAAYLTHEAWLKDFKFYVDERAIVPRSLIADMLLDDEASFIQPWIDTMPDNPKHILDLCTGSGCLAIILAHLYPETEIHAVDLSEQALEVAKKNVHDYNLEQRVKLFHGNLFAPLGNQRYDIIISNPPYVTEESVAKLPAEFLHEPAMALGAGADGLDCIRPMLEQAKNYLDPNGIIVVEVGHNRDIVELAYPQIPFIWFESAENEGHVFLLSTADLEELVI